MTIHFKPLLSTVRFFQNGSYDEKTPFHAVATVQFINDEEAFICGLHGSITRADMKELFKELAEMGITVVRYERHGKEKVKYL
ncbi:MAG: hypothetical protein JXR12_06300 [Neptunomonas phycophila]|uniref:hypothetical protein n=1 Tax=Neptunomonas phycophila TaxID=1572645 RepID=UPI003B8C4EC4